MLRGENARKNEKNGANPRSVSETVRHAGKPPDSKERRGVVRKGSHK
jgi:hypothetical protein